MRCSECSGQEILDPREFMKRAREEMGAQGIDEYRANNPQGGTSSFAGQGQSLDGQSVGNPLAPPPQEHTITFWQNGFTLDDGPLRTADDPANAAFLAAVNRGQMPAELIGEDGNAEGDVHIIDKSGEPYKPPTVAEKPFQGQGRSMREEGSSSGAAAAPVADAQELTLDAAAPTTTLRSPNRRTSTGSTRQKKTLVKRKMSISVAGSCAYVASHVSGAAATEKHTQSERSASSER